MDQCDTYLTLPSICRSVIYILWSSDFASYLEDYLMEKCCTWDNGSLWLKDRPCKIYVGQWPIFHGSLILPYSIVRLKLFLYMYIKKWHRLEVFVPLWALALVVDWDEIKFLMFCIEEYAMSCFWVREIPPQKALTLDKNEKARWREGASPHSQKCPWMCYAWN